VVRVESDDANGPGRGCKARPGTVEPLRGLGGLGCSSQRISSRGLQSAINLKMRCGNPCVGFRGNRY